MKNLPISSTGQTSDFELTYQNVTYYLDRRTVDRVFCAFSRHGLNLSSGLIQRVLDLAPIVIKAIIYKLNMMQIWKKHNRFKVVYGLNI